MKSYAHCAGIETRLDHHIVHRDVAFFMQGPGRFRGILPTPDCCYDANTNVKSGENLRGRNAS
jgi:hypothetical protein